MSNQPVSVRYSRLPSQGVIYGLDKTAVAGVFIVAIIFGVAVIRNGPIGIITSAPVTIPLAILSVLRVHGEPLLTHFGREVIGYMRKMVGANKYRARPEKRKVTADTVLDLPGRQGRLHVYSSALGAAVVWDARLGTATISCVVATPGIGVPLADSPSTLDREVREAYTFEWAKVLGSFTQKEHIKRVAILENTKPGNVAAEEILFNQKVVPGSAVERSYREALSLAAKSAVFHRTQIAITFDTSGNAKSLINNGGGGKRGLLAFAEMEMASTQEALLNAGFTRVAWLTPREYAAWGRNLIDPVADESIDVRIGTEHEGVSVSAAAPMIVNDERTHVETDSAWHRTYWIGEWPRYDTSPGFLSKLVFAKKHMNQPVRHTFMLVTSPVQVGQAMKQIEEDKRTWITNENLRHKAQKPTSAADIADWHAIERHEQELVAGQGELRFSAFLTVSALDKKSLEEECSSIKNACSSVGLEPREMPWQQAEALLNVAFPAGLGMK